MDQDLIQIGDHVAVLRRRWRIIALTLLLGVGLGLAFALSQPSLYRAEAQLLLDPGTTTTTASGLVMSPEEVATQSDVVTSIEVAERVTERLGLDEQPSEVVEGVSVEVVDNKRVLSVAVLESTPQVAADVANAFAEEYIAYRGEETSISQDTVRETYAEQLVGIEDRLTMVRAEIAGASTARANQLRLEEQLLIQREDDVSTALLTLDAEGAGQQAGGEVLREAHPPSAAAQPRPLRSGALGAVVGLMLGVGLAYGRDRLDDAIRDEGRMRSALAGRPLLGQIPESADEGRGRVAALMAPWSPLSEAYRTLNSNVKFLAATEASSSRHLGTVVLVSSAGPAEGKTAVSTNLAVTAARAGTDVIVVDADLRKPSVASRFGLDLPIGLSDLLAEDLPVKPQLYSVGQDNLRILSAGSVPPNPAELLSSPRTDRIIDELSGLCELVIIDSPPIMRVADGLELVRNADLILLVAKQGVSRLRGYTGAVERVRQVGGHLAGGILNHVGEKAVSYGYGVPPAADQTHSTKRRTGWLRRRA